MDMLFNLMLFNYASTLTIEVIITPWQLNLINFLVYKFKRCHSRDEVILGFSKSQKESTTHSVTSPRRGFICLQAIHSSELR